MSLIICSYSADSVTVVSEDRGGIYDAEKFITVASGRVKNLAVTPEIIFGVIGRNTADCMKGVVKEFAAFGFGRLTEIIPTMARACVDCSGPGAALAMILAGWDSEKSKMRAVCWNLYDFEQTCDTWELEAPQGVTGILIRGPQAVQEAAQRLIAQKRVPDCFEEVFSQLSDMFPEIGRVLTANTVTRPSGEHLGNKQAALTHEDTLGNGAGTKVSWTAITVYQPDGSTVVIPASTDATQKATVPSPTLSTVVGGSKAARTYFVRLAYSIDGGLRGFGPEASISVPANSLLKVTSPANTPPWAGYNVFVSTSTNTETWVSTTAMGGNDFGVPFGTDWTEPTGALTVLGPQFGSVNGKGLDGDMNTAVGYNQSLFFYPYFDKDLSLVRMYNEGGTDRLTAGTASDPKMVRGMYKDHHMALAASGIKFTTITVAQGGAGTTTGVSGTGGCPIVGTKIVPIGYACMTHRKKNSLWTEVELADGRTLTATPDHPVYTPDRGKIRLCEVEIGNELVTDVGLIKVIRAEPRTIDSEMEIISMTKGHLYYANGILSHNIKLPQQ
jgi:hypothetical protein